MLARDRGCRYVPERWHAAFGRRSRYAPRGPAPPAAARAAAPCAAARRPIAPVETTPAEQLYAVKIRSC